MIFHLYYNCIFKGQMCDRGRAETFADVRSNVPKGYKGFPVDDGNDMEIPMMYSQKLDMSPKDIMST